MAHQARLCLFFSCMYLLNHYRKRFVRCVDNLKAIMMLLRESRSPITQYEVRA